MELTEFEEKLWENIVQRYSDDENYHYQDVISDLRKIMPPTCSKNERAFLDEIREKGEMDGFDFYPNRWVKIRGSENTVINQSDFTKSNLSELMEGEG